MVCDGKNLTMDLRMRLPISIINGNFFDLSSLKSPDLVLKLKPAEVKFLFL